MFWILCVPLAIYFWQLSTFHETGQAAGPYVISLAVILSWWTASVVAHVKESLADPRAQLIPSYRAPHLLVGAAAVALLCVALPWCVAQWVELPPVVVIGLVALTATLVAWMAYWQAPSAVVILLGLILFLSSNSSAQWMFSAILRGNQPRAALCVLATAALLIALLWLRMMLLHEEMPEYSRLPVSGWRLRPAMTGERGVQRLAAAEALWLNASFGHSLFRAEHVASVYNASLLHRVRHWRVVTSPGLVPWIVGLALGAWICVLPMLERHRQPDWSMIAPVVTIVLPLPFVGFGWLRRWPLLSYEMTRPVTRDKYFLEIGLALFWDLCHVFLAMFVCGLIPVVLWMPNNIADHFFSSFYPVVATSTFALFAVNIWLLRLRNAWLMLFSIIGSAILVLLPFALVMVLADGISTWGRNRDTFGLTRNPGHEWLISTGVAAWVILFLLVAGIMICISAYSRWTQMDLD
jgi:hypothetical protein